MASLPLYKTWQLKQVQYQEGKSHEGDLVLAGKTEMLSHPWPTMSAKKSIFAGIAGRGYRQKD